MVDREIVIQCLRELFNEERGDIVCAYLFGSVARGEQTASSDVDIAVLFDPPPPPRLLGPMATLSGQMEAVCGVKVDLVMLNDAAPDLVHRVLRDGILLCERNPARRIRFETAARSAYFDLQPYLEEYRRGPHP
jgi:predicted nucleotidyltransferase